MLSFLIERQWRVKAYKGGGVGWGIQNMSLIRRSGLAIATEWLST